MYDLYQIIKGDTINTIASKYGTSPEVLKSLNPNSTFAVGTYIAVPTLKEYFNIPIYITRPCKIKNRYIFTSRVRPKRGRI